MQVMRHRVALTTADDGTATGYTPKLTGQVVNVIYTKADFAAGVDFTITAEDSGLKIWDQDDVNASAIVSPMQPLHDQIGVALLYADTGKPVCGPIYLCQERVKIGIGSGGEGKKGTFDVLVIGPTG